jgi:hypothetical protein
MPYLAAVKYYLWALFGYHSRSLPCQTTMLTLFLAEPQHKQRDNGNDRSGT